MNGISGVFSLLALSLLVACGGLESGSNSHTSDSDTASVTDDGDEFGWDSEDDDNNNGSDDEDTNVDDTDTEDTNSDSDDTDDTDTDVTELASGSYDIASGDAEPSLVPSEGRVILMLACDGDITGVQAHAINDSTGNQDYWFEMDDSNEDGPEHDSGEFLMDDAINPTTVLWSEFEASEDDDVSLNGYGWNDADWSWLAGGDSIMESVCIGVMIHADGSGKLCLPEDNDLGGGDLYCDPAYNEVDLDQQVADAITAALEEMLEEYYGGGDTDGGSTSTTETHTVCFKNVDSDVDEMVGYWLTDSNADNWFTDSDIDSVSGSEGMLLWWDSSGDSLCANITTDVSDSEVQLNGYVQLDDGTEDYLVFGNDSSDSWADATIDGANCAIESNGSTYGGDIVCSL